MSLDPPCSLYWLFAGVLFALPKVAESETVRQFDNFRAGATDYVKEGYELPYSISPHGVRPPIGKTYA
jgi:hypothetical protein